MCPHLSCPYGMQLCTAISDWWQYYTRGIARIYGKGVLTGA